MMKEKTVYDQNNYVHRVTLIVGAVKRKKMFYLVIIYFLMNSMKELLAEGAYRCFDKTFTPKHYKKKKKTKQRRK